MGSCLCEGLSSVNLATSSLYADFFELIIRFVISREDANLISCVNRHNCSRVTDVDYINHVVNYHNDSSTGAGALRTNGLACHQVLGTGLCLFNQRQKVALALSKAFFDGLDRVLGELVVLNHKVVQVISQVISTGRASVPIEDTEKADLRPVHVEVGFVLGLEYIQDDGDAVFVVVSDDALIGVGCV